MRPRVIYMGTPDFSVPALDRIAKSDVCDLALVVTQPDRPAGRGKKRVAPPVKVAADALNVPVLQVSTLKDPETRQRIIDVRPDLIVVAAFGMILGKWVLTLPPRGCVNLHASLLPKYRGANPIAAAIAEGEEVTGVTLMQMERGLDTGPIYAATVVDILEDDTTGSLTPRLAHVAGDLLSEHLPALLDGSLPAVPQGEEATLTRQMVKADGWLDFTRPAEDLERHIRAMWPWPRAWTTAPGGERIQVHAAGAMEETVSAPGVTARRGGTLVIGTDNGTLVLRRVQLPGGKPIEGSALLQVKALAEGNVLGAVNPPGPLPPLVALAVGAS